MQPVPPQLDPGDSRRPSREEALRLARRRKLARQQRIRRIRMRAVGFTVALFIAAWATIFVQLSSGHDPALAAARPAAKAPVLTAFSGSATDVAGSSAGAVDRAGARVAPPAATAATADTAGVTDSTTTASQGTQNSTARSTDTSSSVQASAPSPAPVTTSQS